MKIKRYIFISILLIFTPGYSTASPIDTTGVIRDTTDVLRGLDLKRVPSVDTLHRVAKKYLGKWAYLFLAIKIEESGNNGHYSWLSVNHYNMCGMRFPRSRRTYATGSTSTNYAIYRNWFECMLDFKLYLEIIEANFVEKHKKPPNDDIEMNNYIYNSFNHFAKWKKDMMILIRYVKKKYK